MKTKTKDLSSIFTAQLPTLQTEQMDSDTSSMYIRLLMMEKTGNQEEIEALYTHLSGAVWSLEALKKRGEHCLSIPFTTSILCFISILTEGNIGQGLLYMYYLQWAGKQKDYTQISFIELYEIFPWGFFIEDSLHTLWDAQKDETGKNIIDNGELCKSIQ